MPNDTQAQVPALRKWRLSKGVTLESLAAQIGYSKGRLSQVEAGKGPIRRSIIEGYERVLDLPRGTLTEEYDAASAREPLTELLQWAIQERERAGGREQEISDTLEVNRDAGHAKAHLQPFTQSVRETMLVAQSLLERAISKNSPSDQPIVLTFYSDLDAFDLAPTKLRDGWVRLLAMALDQGWKVVHVRRLPSDISVRIKRVKDMLFLLGRKGQYLPHYFLDQGLKSATFQNMLVVPGEGALLFFGTSANCMESALFLDAKKEKEQVEFLQNYYGELEANIAPLLKLYPSRSLEFDHAIVKADEQPGDMMMIKNGLSTALIPISVIAGRESRVMKESTALNEDALREHKERYETLRQNRIEHQKLLSARLKDHHVRYILSEEGLVELIKTGRVTTDDWLLGDMGDNEAARLTKDEIVDCLTYTLELLKTHSNLEIGLVGKHQPEAAVDLFKIYIDIVDSHAVLLETLQDAEGQELDLALLEPGLIAAMRVFFTDLWENGDLVNHEKTYVEDWFSGQIEDLTR